MTATLKLDRRPRTFLGEDFMLTDWASVEPFYQDLLHRPIEDADALRQWIAHRSELEAYLSENMAWRYIRMTCDTTDAEKQAAYQFFVQEIQPHLAEFDDVLNKKLLDSPFVSELTNSGFPIMLRSIRKAVEIFRTENIEIATQIQGKQTEYQAITGKMTVTINGEEMPLPKAALMQLSVNRKVRQEAWEAVAERRLADKEALDTIFDELLQMRHQLAVNANFDNFRDYMFAAMGRFDYTPADCFAFHESVKKTVVPVVNELALHRKPALGYEQLRPWDSKVDTQGRPALKPFQNTTELIEKTIACFDALHPKLGNYLRIMQNMGHFDLDARKGKAPGGYNYPLEEIGVPFIFMNATASMRDVITMLHEGGHAVHSFEVRDLPITNFRSTPSEVAELASMSMELISMDYWDVFFDNPQEVKRAKIEHLEDILTVLPWIATIDKFQHWIYENPTHTAAERKAYWLDLFSSFSDTITDWSGWEEAKAYQWQRQLHLYEVPFYYIEYGMAQLGAISVWRNFRADKEAGLNGYLAALKLGYTAPIRDIYAAANIRFDFSESYIAELMDFVKSELTALKTA